MKKYIVGFIFGAATVLTTQRVLKKMNENKPPRTKPTLLEDIQSAIIHDVIVPRIENVIFGERPEPTPTPTAPEFKYYTDPGRYLRVGNNPFANKLRRSAR